MEKSIYLIIYFDNEDLSRGVICASESWKPTGTGVENRIREWLKIMDRTFTEDDIKTAANNLVTNGAAHIGDYDLYVETTLLY